MWKQWFQQADALVMLPGAEGKPSVVWTEQERRVSHKACVTERRIHSNPVKRQHMFTVTIFVLVKLLYFTSHIDLLYKLCSHSARLPVHAQQWLGSHQSCQLHAWPTETAQYVGHANPLHTEYSTSAKFCEIILSHSPQSPLVRALDQV